MWCSDSVIAQGIHIRCTEIHHALILIFWPTHVKPETVPHDVLGCRIYPRRKKTTSVSPPYKYSVL